MLGINNGPKIIKTGMKISASIIIVLTIMFCFSKMAKCFKINRRKLCGRIKITNGSNNTDKAIIDCGNIPPIKPIINKAIPIIKIFKVCFSKRTIKYVLVADIKRRNIKKGVVEYMKMFPRIKLIKSKTKRVERNLWFETKSFSLFIILTFNQLLCFI